MVSERAYYLFVLLPSFFLSSSLSSSLPIIVIFEHVRSLFTFVARLCRFACAPFVRLLTFIYCTRAATSRSRSSLRSGESQAPRRVRSPHMYLPRFTVAPETPHVETKINKINHRVLSPLISCTLSLWFAIYFLFLLACPDFCQRHNSHTHTIGLILTRN